MVLLFIIRNRVRDSEGAGPAGRDGRDAERGRHDGGKGARVTPEGTPSCWEPEESGGPRGPPPC